MPTTKEALAVALLFLVPGYVFDAVYGRSTTRPAREATETVLSLLLWSLINYALCSPLLVWLAARAAPRGPARYAADNPAPALLVGLLVLLIAPTIEALIVARLVRNERVGGFFSRTLGLRVQPIPKGWDYVFSRNRYYLVLLTLNDGTKIGGGWGSESFASSFPAEEDLYLEVVYSIDEGGQFGNPIPLSAGLLLKRADIRTIELFTVPQGDNDESE